jgi:hypothetical protein
MSRVVGAWERYRTRWSRLDKAFGPHQDSGIQHELAPSFSDTTISKIQLIHLYMCTSRASNLKLTPASYLPCAQKQKIRRSQGITSPHIMHSQKPVTVARTADLQTSGGQTDGMIRQNAIVDQADNICASIMIAKPHSASAVHHHGHEGQVFICATRLY